MWLSRSALMAIAQVRHMIAVEVLEHALVITAFVFVMMLTVEYLNIVTRGEWQVRLQARGWRQHVLAGFLGATPGCLGAFTNVVLYEHGIIAAGALVAGMIATSGDAIFVMLAMVPRQAILLTCILLVLGILVGLAIDRFGGRNLVRLDPTCVQLELHEDESFGWTPGREVLAEWRQCSLQRGVLVGAILIFLVALGSGQVGVHTEVWLRVTMMLASLLGLFIVATVPEHFLEEHLWNHVAKKHLPAIFFWTSGALFLVEFLSMYAPAEQWVPENMALVLVIACIVGIIPDSGPHLVFVTMFADGVIPFSVLLANSIVQDGHGMLPLLACSRRGFIKVKAINFVLGMLVGFVVYKLGY